MENIQLALENVTSEPLGPDAGGSDMWQLTCDAHLIIDYARPDNETFEFLGPAEFDVRRNPNLPSSWQLVECHDQLPDGT